jgi:hypothetical protein
LGGEKRDDVEGLACELKKKEGHSICTAPSAMGHVSIWKPCIVVKDNEAKERGEDPNQSAI